MELISTNIISTNQESANINNVNDADTLKNLDNQAKLYIEQRKLNEAEPLRQRALAMREEILGPEHLDTAESIHNLSLLYLMQHKYYVGERLCRRALAIREKVLGPTHPLTTESLNTLGQFIAVQAKQVKNEWTWSRLWSMISKIFPGLFFFLMVGFGLWMTITSSMEANAKIFIRTVLGALLEALFGPNVGILLETLLADQTTKRFQSSVVWGLIHLRKPLLIGFYFVSFGVLGYLFITWKSIKAKTLVIIGFIGLLAWIFYPRSVHHIPASDSALSTIVLDFPSNVSTLNSEPLTPASDVAFQTSVAPTLTSGSTPGLISDLATQTFDPNATLSTLSSDISTKPIIMASSSLISDSANQIFTPNVTSTIVSEKKSSWIWMWLINSAMGYFFFVSFLGLFSEDRRTLILQVISNLLIMIASIAEILLLERSMLHLHRYYTDPRPISVKLGIWGFFLVAFLLIGAPWFLTIAFFCNVVNEIFFRISTLSLPSSILDILPLIINGLIVWLILIPAL